jgi:hypothetical protein
LVIVLIVIVVIEEEEEEEEKVFFSIVFFSFEGTTRIRLILEGCLIGGVDFFLEYIKFSNDA